MEVDSLMRKHYRTLLVIIIIEWIIIVFLNRIGFSAQSWIGNVIGVFIVLLPIEAMLFLLSNDERFSSRKKTCFRLGFWFLAISYLSGIIGTIV